MSLTIKRFLNICWLPLLVIYFFLPWGEEYFVRPGREVTRLGLMILALVGALAVVAIQGIPSVKSLLQWKRENDLFISLLVAAFVAFVGLAGPWSHAFYEQYPQMVYLKELATPIFIIGLGVIVCVGLIGKNLGSRK